MPNQTIADCEWWDAFGKTLGWRLYGWTYRNGASFFNTADQLVEITATTRADIEARKGGSQ